MDKRNFIRLEAFRQLKREIRGSKRHLVVGIDIAKEKHSAFFGTAVGKVLVKRLVFTNTREGFEKLLLYAESTKVRHGLEEKVFGLEPTANYHKPLGEYLIRKGCHVVYVSGAAVTHNREMLDNRWDKNDTRDPANIADLISQGKFMYYDYPILPLRELREFLSLKRKLKKQAHGMSVRIRNHLLAQYFPELDSYYRQGEKSVLSIVKWCLSPAAIGEMSYEAFEKLTSPGNRITASQRARLRMIWFKAKESIGCEAEEGAKTEAEITIEVLRHLRRAIGILEDKIEGISQQFPSYKYLRTIPGFGPAVTSEVLSAIGNPYRFESRKQVLKLAGYDLSARRSGKTSTGSVPVISKRGKNGLRYLLYQAAFVASTRDKHFIGYYTDKLKGREREKGIGPKRRVKLAAKLLIIAWTLMKKQEVFDPAYLDRVRNGRGRR